ncbi:MAG: MBL fold metallo-hydrolase [archaeon]|nr:MBL fold metallo-hydrolase [archaeon]
MEMKFKFLGGADVVGRMGMVMEGDGKVILMDYGMNPTKPPEYPLPAPRVDHVLLTHCHLDHCGVVPQVCKRDTCELFTTPLSAEVGEIMMYDSLKIANAESYPLPYVTGDIEKTMQNVVPMTYGDTFDLGNIEVTMHSAGHVPGAAMFEFGVDTSTLYSGDIHTIKQRLVNGARSVDCQNLFIEGTYGGRIHPDRKIVEEQFLDKVDEVVERGGTVLVPCFAVGRTQEIMILLNSRDYDMWVDGMGRAITRIYLNYPRYLASARSLWASKRKFKEVYNANTRRKAGSASVIVTTGGMLDGGPALGYLSRLKNDPKNAILLVGYQADDTNGNMLMNRGCVKIDGEIVKVNCEVQKYDFSAHADHEEIVDFINACHPENIVMMHSETRELFLRDLADYNVILPRTGEEFTLQV